MEWIPIKDLPKESGMYIYKTKGVGVGRCYYSADPKSTINEYWDSQNITHWLDETTPAQSGEELLSALKNDYDDLIDSVYSKEKLEGYKDCIWDICLTLGKKEWFSENIINHITKKTNPQ